MPPRAVLISTAPGFIEAMRAASNRPRVESTSGTCRLTTSALRDQLVQAGAAHAGLRRRRGGPSSIIASKAITVMPRPARSVAVSWPIEPKPIRPSVLPAISRPLRQRRARPLPGGHRRAWTGRRRAAAACAVPITYSATRQRIGAGGRNHLHAARLAAGHVDVVQPHAEPADHLAARAAPPAARRAPGCGCARSSASAVARLGDQARRVVDQRRVVQHVVRGRAAARPRARP